MKREHWAMRAQTSERERERERDRERERVGEERGFEGLKERGTHHGAHLVHSVVASTAPVEPAIKPQSHSFA